MNKKLKTLLLAGLLTLGMNTLAFANESELPITSTSSISYPQFVDGKRVVELQGGLLVVDMTETVGSYSINPLGLVPYDYGISVKWKDGSLKITRVESFYENGFIDHSMYFDTNNITNDFEYEDGFTKATVQGGGLDETSSPRGKLLKLEITFENLTKISVPVEPEEEIEDPATGDATTIGFLFTGALATLGLYKMNKDEE